MANEGGHTHGLDVWYADFKGFDREITKLSTTTAEQLKHPIHNLPASASTSGHDKDVIELSEKCTKTAAELLSELSRLKQGPGDGFRQVVGKTVRTMRRKKYLAKTQEKLESYRDILNIRILSQLEFRAVLHDARFDKLDEMIKTLVVALNVGRNTYAKMMTDQTATMITHIDRRHDQMNQEKAHHRLRDEIIENLFYPEIFSRFEDIAESHDGTCQWFFKSSRLGADTESLGQASLSDPPAASSSEDPLINNNRSSLSRISLEDVQYDDYHLAGIRVRPWDNFEEWFKSDGDDPYWLSGKPGSGKSTLMKYICTKIHDYRQSLEPSSPWGSAHDVIMCSFFFWSLGSSIQKNYRGLLKSLLYQIAHQWEDSIPLMSRQVKSARSSLLHQWTEERLEEALKLFLLWKPSTLRVYIFIDGLDEYEGDENKLMNIIRLMSQSPGTKVCASSRPEEIFRQDFADCPHVRLQDLNYPDIFRAASDRLIPALSNRFSDSRSDSRFDDPRQRTKWLIQQLTEKSQGIFLWAELMTKDIITGARHADTFSELEDRLDRTPDTIDGLYTHVLKRLDKSYVREATTHFHHLMAYEEDSYSYDNSPTLLHFACNEESAWAQIGRRITAYFLTSDFQESCRNTEIRILSRCAGLVEIDESRLAEVHWLHPPKGGVLINQDEECLSRYLRKVKFIHKTARDFVRSKFEYFENSDCRVAGVLATARGRIAIAYLMPNMMSELETTEGPILLDYDYITTIMATYRPSTQDLPAMHGAASQIINLTYDLLYYLNEKLNGSRYEVSECYTGEFVGLGWGLPWPLAHVLDFASFFGRWDFIQNHMSKESNSTQEDVERVVSAAILGLGYLGSQLTMNNYFLNQMNGNSNILLEYLPRSSDTMMHASTGTVKHQLGNHSKWTILLVSVSYLILGLTINAHQKNLEDTVGLCKQLIKTLMKYDPRANINIRLTHSINIRLRDQEPTSIVRIIVKETLLAFVKRRMFWNLDLSTDIETFLYDLGATDCRSFHGISYFISHNWSHMGLPLTHPQSERLSHIYSHERLRHETIGMVPERFIELAMEDTMPTEPIPEAEDIVKLLESLV